MSGKPAATMKYVRLGKTGLKVSKVSEILHSIRSNWQFSVVCHMVQTLGQTGS